MSGDPETKKKSGLNPRARLALATVKKRVKGKRNEANQAAADINTREWRGRRSVERNPSPSEEGEGRGPGGSGDTRGADKKGRRSRRRR